MKTQRYGRILLVSSGAGRGASRTGIHGYAAAKAGLLGFVRQVAKPPPNELSEDEMKRASKVARRGRLISLVSALGREHTVVIIEHDMDVVFATADRVTVLHLGEVLARGSPGDVRANPKVQDVYLGAVQPGGP